MSAKFNNDALRLAAPPFSHEFIPERKQDQWRIRDSRDDAVGSAINEADAIEAVALLNKWFGVPTSPPSPPELERERLVEIITADRWFVSTTKANAYALADAILAALPRMGVEEAARAFDAWIADEAATEYPDLMDSEGISWPADHGVAQRLAAGLFKYLSRQRSALTKAATILGGK